MIVKTTKSSTTMRVVRNQVRRVARVVVRWWEGRRERAEARNVLPGKKGVRGDCGRGGDGPVARGWRTRAPVRRMKVGE